MPGSHAEIEDDRVIRELLQNWAIWRDAGDWERFRTVWHPDGRMMATWTQGTGDEFIEISKQAWAKGVSILHFLGGISVDLAGHRAISQTKMTISQRAEGRRCRASRVSASSLGWIGLSPLPLAGSRRAKLALRSDRIARCDPGGGSSIHTDSVTRGYTPTPTLPRKRERERSSDAVAI